MTDREKQIEEMAQVLEAAKIKALATIGSLNDGFGEWYAKALHNAGYRKIPEDAVVVTREEYEKLQNEIKRRQKEREVVGKALIDVTTRCAELTADFTDMIDELYDLASKETAREILDKVDYESNGQTIQITNLLRKRYGVEVE